MKCQGGAQAQGPLPKAGKTRHWLQGKGGASAKGCEQNLHPWRDISLVKYAPAAWLDLKDKKVARTITRLKKV